jgi:hypothetical protein
LVWPLVMFCDGCWGEDGSSIRWLTTRYIMVARARSRRVWRLSSCRLSNIAIKYAFLPSVFAHDIPCCPTLNCLYSSGLGYDGSIPYSWRILPRILHLWLDQRFVACLPDMPGEARDVHPKEG